MMESRKLIHKFWEYNTENPLGSSAVAMYLYIVNEYENTGVNEIVLSDAKISETLKIVRNTVRITKDKLRKAGFLTYETKLGFPCVYKLVFSNSQKVDTKEPIKNKELNTKKIDIKSVPKQEIKSILDKNIKEPPKVSVKKQESKIVQKQEPKVETPKLPSNIPSLDEFLAYAKSVEIYDETSPNIDFLIKTKYENWVSNGWKNGYGKPIRNWQISLKATLPHLLTDKKNDFVKAPVIKRPKQTYDE